MKGMIELTGISLVISAAGFVFTAMAFVVGRLSAAGKRGREEGELKTELKYIKMQVDKLLEKAEEREKYDRMAEAAYRIAASEHNRLNKHLRDEHKHIGLEDINPQNSYKGFGI